MSAETRTRLLGYAEAKRVAAKKGYRLRRVRVPVGGCNGGTYRVEAVRSGAEHGRLFRFMSEVAEWLESLS